MQVWIKPDGVLSVPEFGVYEDEDNCVIQEYLSLLDEYYEPSGWDIQPFLLKKNAGSLT